LGAAEVSRVVRFRGWRCRWCSFIDWSRSQRSSMNDVLGPPRYKARWVDAQQ